MLQSDGFGPAYRYLARREPVFARLDQQDMVTGGRDRLLGYLSGDHPLSASAVPAGPTAEP